MRGRTETPGYLRGRKSLSGWPRVRCRYQFCQFPEVLGSSCENELIVCPHGATQSKPIKLENTFEMGEQHFDLLAEPAVPAQTGGAAGGVFAATQMLRGAARHGADLLAAISCGAVFMGANTYIGNAPNFMVKSIAEEAGVNMPSFFGYMFKFSLPILIPVFILVTFIFF